MEEFMGIHTHVCCEYSAGLGGKCVESGNRCLEGERKDKRENDSFIFGFCAFSFLE